jgi:hypothetical protein
VEGNVEDQLKLLLENYNFVVIAPSPGKIEKIIITSLKQPPDKRYVSPYVVTTHVGANTGYRLSSPDRTTRIKMSS